MTRVFMLMFWFCFNLSETTTYAAYFLCSNSPPTLLQFIITFISTSSYCVSYLPNSHPDPDFYDNFKVSDINAFIEVHRSCFGKVYIGTYFLEHLIVGVDILFQIIT